jgi:hypothetical protein
MINIIGIVIIISGFFAPYLSSSNIPAMPFFWLGGLVFLNKGILIKSDATWMKWARIGILINIFFFIVMLATFYALNERPITSFVQRLSMVPYWLSKPATALGQQIPSFSEMRYSDDPVTFHIGFSRTAIADFLDVVAYMASAAAVGLLRMKTQANKAS